MSRMVHAGSALLSDSVLRPLVQRALAEDEAARDATTQATVDADGVLRARVVARQPGIVCGRAVAACVFHQLDPKAQLRGREDGERIEAGALVWEIAGRAHAILAGERVMLNFVQHLCGIATLTARFVDAVASTGVAIVDTRKTTPGLRALEKYAVRCGGGVNHRMSLSDMLLIKENHIAAAGSVELALQRAQAASRGRPVEIEVRRLDEFRRVLPFAPERVLLDHWSVEDIREAVRLRGDATRPAIEVSGNLDLDNVRRFALPGVAFLSVGRLTHSAPALDLSLLLEALS